MSAETLERLRAFMSGAVPYWKTLGLELVEVEPGKAVFECTVHGALLQNKMLHGGVLASIADSACAVAAISKTFPDNYATTINLQMSYLRPVFQGRIRAEGKCVRAGRNVVFCEAAIYDENLVLVSTASSQLLVVPWRSGENERAPQEKN